MRRGLLVAAAVALVTAAAALAVPGDASLEVRLSEFRIEAPRSVSAGESGLVVRNSGRVDHDLVIVRTRRAAGDLPVGLSGVAPQLAGTVVFGEPHSAHEHGARRHHYPAGTSKRSAVELAPGKYVLLCTLPGHYERGQWAPLEVRPR